MGVDANALRFLAEAARVGVDFTRTLTLGRQNFYRLDPMLLRHGLSQAGFSLTLSEAEEMFHRHGGYADDLFQFLGARSLASTDFSAYEKATYVFDMNRPSPADLDGAFTTVVDGGSLEHIFHFPQAMANCMNMVAMGGHFIGLTPANNYFGHGFYQFSAELFFRVFDAQNGFVTERMVLVEDDQSGQGWFDVTDPAQANERVTLTSAAQAQLFIVARKVAQRIPFSTPPYQSDYVIRWALEAGGAQVVAKPTFAARARATLSRFVPQQAKRWLRNKLFPGPRTRPDLFRPYPINTSLAQARKRAAP